MASENNDLDAFFKKQKQKKKKRGVVQDVDALGKKLDKNVRKQEQFDREEEERTQRNKESENQEATNEDSEWHSYTPDVDLTVVKLKDMDMAEQEDERLVQEEESRENVKTWNIPGENGDAENGHADEKPPPPEEESAKQPRAYVPPSARLARANAASAKAPALGDQEAFPTLGAAVEISKEQEQAKKRQEHIKLLETAGGARHPETNQKENENDGFTTQVYRPPRERVTGPSAPTNAWQRKPVTAAPKPGSYVPPHLRNQQAKLQEGNRYSNLTHE